MTLNFSPQPIFPLPSLPESEFVSSIWERGTEGLRRGYHCGIDEPYNFGRDGGGINTNATCEPMYNDIIDMLPSDPFNMEMRSTWRAAIAGWFEDLRTEYSGDYGVAIDADYHFVSGLDYACDNTAWFSPGPGPIHGDSSYRSEEYLSLPGISPHIEEFPSASNVRDVLSPDMSGEGWVVDLQSMDHVGFDTSCVSQRAGSISMSEQTTGEIHVDSDLVEKEGHAERSYNNGDWDVPHDAFFFALPYLEVPDLLNVERVCKTLRSAVQNDPLLWRCIHISNPLSDRLTDDALFHLTQRAQGSLQCLNLVECPKITDDGINRVLEANKRISKLSLPGCVRLTCDGLVNILKGYPDMPGIKHLVIGGCYGVSQTHYEDLKSLLGLSGHQQPKARKPRFYHRRGLSSSSCDYDRALDVELCPRCQNLRLVYDCPVESCQRESSVSCRACRICIARCFFCGRCITDGEFEETFCLDNICFGCMNERNMGQEGPNYGADSSKLMP